MKFIIKFISAPPLICFYDAHTHTNKNNYKLFVETFFHSHAEEHNHHNIPSRSIPYCGCWHSTNEYVVCLSQMLRTVVQTCVCATVSHESGRVSPRKVASCESEKERSEARVYKVVDNGARTCEIARVHRHFSPG